MPIRVIRGQFPDGSRHYVAFPQGRAPARVDAEFHISPDESPPVSRPSFAPSLPGEATVAVAVGGTALTPEGGWRSTSRGEPLAVLCRLSSVVCPLPSVFRPLPSVLCLLSSTFCPLPSVRLLSPDFYLLPSALRLLSSVFSRPSSPSVRLSRCRGRPAATGARGAPCDARRAGCRRAGPGRRGRPPPRCRGASPVV